MRKRGLLSFWGEGHFYIGGMVCVFPKCKETHFILFTLGRLRTEGRGRFPRVGTCVTHGWEFFTHLLFKSGSLPIPLQHMIDPQQIIHILPAHSHHILHLTTLVEASGRGLVGGLVHSDHPIDNGLQVSNHECQVGDIVIHVGEQAFKPMIGVDGDLALFIICHRVDVYILYLSIVYKTMRTAELSDAGGKVHLQGARGALVGLPVDVLSWRGEARGGFDS